MADMVRVLMVDLLVERETFGHGGNQEVVRPFAAAGDVELLLAVSYTHLTLPTKA